MLKIEEIEKIIQNNSGTIINPEVTKNLIIKAAKAGICPECGAKLILVNVKRHFFGPKGKDAWIECPNKHNIDFNKQFSVNEGSYCFGYNHFDLSYVGNSLYNNTQNKEIKDLYDRLCSWLSD
ncbi:hypothetical protein M0Q97_10715 [Candidatus Dojkabacteria bacterium]|jgi:ssDNA-binding Zn-finger/Zn-ribbon topoisomerase 1|nr:hypothetical protein [Candidatus Dojkabacteria bacterium]